MTTATLIFCLCKHGFRFWKIEKLDFLKSIQPIYLRKSNGLSCMKSSNKVLIFNITNGKEKKACRICVYGNEKGLSLTYFW